MNQKTTVILYWILLILFSLFMVMDAIGGLMKAEAGQEVLKHLGYPVYIMPFFGIAKLLGAIAILQTRFNTIKEWAYAGFAFNFIGAFWSRAAIGDAKGLLVPPIIMLVILFLVYFLWKKSGKQKSAGRSVKMAV